MIITLTLNPSVDISTTIDHLVPEQKLRCAAARYDPGGGGINVSRAIHRLGGKSRAVFPVGGATGSLLEQLVAEQQIDFQTVPMAGWTRQSFVVTETSTRQQFRFGLPGPAWSMDERELFLNTVLTFPKPIDYVVISGSFPPGLPADYCAVIARIVRQRGARLILDTSGEPLRMAVQEGAFLLKPNLGELASLVGVDKLELDEVEEAARSVIQRGWCEVVVLSLGPAGALLVAKTGHADQRIERFRVPAPTVKKQSTVGAGDSMVGGMIYALSQGKSYEEMLRFGVACGTAATMNPGTELFHKDDVERLLNWINQSGKKVFLPVADGIN
ncbi:1-phosphofructokinase family hexose kinase [Larkinella rosea]|uniref:1-phosphofructokinase family hexose kinase n=1 Tax=Larkinella rosea TaxID=2025312 RepID=A0A3P1BG21_9BACT|nr:1-phosphofructokinase family hexose kinase [Larkinella rosea]RRB00005.1 1-phosphofructokinase family hexose kinase [Larkinella rosea]